MSMKLLLLAVSAFHVAGFGVQLSPAKSGYCFIDFNGLESGYGSSMDGVALMNLDPEDDDFGLVLDTFMIGEGVSPHHLYFNHDDTKLLTTALGGNFLYEVFLSAPGKIEDIVAINTGANIIGEDVYFTTTGEYWVTFMGGQGGEKDGSVGVFDSKTNALKQTILASVPDELSDEPYIMWPHGISCNEEQGLCMVTSTIHPDLASGVGNSITLIDMATKKVLKTYLVADTGTASGPVEVVMLRDDFFPGYAMVNTMIGGDIWMAAYNKETGLYDEFFKVFEGDDYGLAWGLEFYVGPGDDPASDEDWLLYVSHGSYNDTIFPGAAVSVFDEAALAVAAGGGSLAPRKMLPAANGAHHMVFFTTKSGREVMAVQNNLLNLDGLNAGTIMVVDIHTGDVVGTADMATDHKLMPESLELASGKGHYLHH